MQAGADLDLGEFRGVGTGVDGVDVVELQTQPVGLSLHERPAVGAAREIDHVDMHSTPQVVRLVLLLGQCR